MRTNATVLKIIDLAERNGDRMWEIVSIDLYGCDREMKCIINEKQDSGWVMSFYTTDSSGLQICLDERRAKEVFCMKYSLVDKQS